MDGRTISAQAARQRLGELLESVFYRGDDVVIERAGQPMAVVIPYARYTAMETAREAARERFFQMVDEIREQNRGVDPEEVEREVEAAIVEVRRERRERREAEPPRPMKAPPAGVVGLLS